MHRIDSDFVIVPTSRPPRFSPYQTHLTAVFQCVFYLSSLSLILLIVVSHGQMNEQVNEIIVPRLRAG